MNELTMHHMEMQIKEAEEMTNSLSGLCETFQQNGLFGNLYGSPGAQISQVDTIFNNLRWYLISNLRQLLSQLYVEYGIVQTLVDQPVDDAFRAGYEIKTSQLSKDQIGTLKFYVEANQTDHHIMQAIKWGRLYGGGAVLIIVPQDYKKPLNLNSIGANTPLEFRSADMWELFYSAQNVAGDLMPGGALGANSGDHYDYYGRQLHKTRVLKIVGKEAPAFIRPRLRGWGMSAVEPLVRSLNQYIKNQDVVFELLDEAKVDVYKIKGYNSSLLTTAGTDKIATQIALANRLKNFQSALTMDKEDEWEQKQITFAGLAEVLLQIRQGLAADLKMPMTKLFGISAAGFNSGEDDIENYNSMVEGEIRNKNKYLVINVLSICCQKLFGMMPSDLMITFNPLRILNAKEEEEVKDSQFNRTMSSYQSGLIPSDETKRAINKDSLLPVEINENTPADLPIDTGGADYSVGGGSDKGASGKSGGSPPDKGKAV